MRKPRNVIGSFSYPVDFDPLILEASEIAEREGKSLSKLIVELIANYVKAHGKGNPNFKLEQFEQEAFFALPTIGEPQKQDKLKELEDSDFEELIRAIRARAQEVNAEIRRRGYMWEWSLR